MRHARGFTLLETIISGVLICIIFFVVMSIFPTSLFALRRGHDMIAATSVASRTLETMRAGDFTQLTEGARDLPAVSVDGTRFNVNMTVARVADDLRHLTVRVSWDATGVGVASGAVQLETRVYKFRR